MKSAGFVFLIATVIVGCGGENGGEPINMDAPVLDSIGDKNISPGSQLTINLSATDPNDDTVTYSYTVLSSNDPFNPPSGMQAIWAPVATPASFTWTPGAADIGDYRIRFTATDDSTSSLSDSEDVTISVVAAVSLGETLYIDSCVGSGCHTAGDDYRVRCVDAGGVENAVRDNASMNSSSRLSGWTLEDSNNIAPYLIAMGEAFFGSC